MSSAVEAGTPELSGSTSVLTRIEDGIGHILLNRPEAMNAVTLELALALDRALAELDSRAGAIVIRGAGSNFSVGGDFRYLEWVRSQRPEEMAELFEAFGAACARIAELDAAVIAAVEGYALAGGFELMLACDLAVVHEDAKLADHHANFDQVPGGGSTQRLPRLVGRSRALGLLLTGERISAARAVDWGLAHRAPAGDEFEPGVAELAAALAERDRATRGKVKALVHEGLEMSLAEGLALERRAVTEHLLGEAGGRGAERFSARAENGSA